MVDEHGQVEQLEAPYLTADRLHAGRDGDPAGVPLLPRDITVTPPPQPSESFKSLRQLILPLGSTWLRTQP